MSLQDIRPLILRSNRSLAAMLMEKRLVNAEQLDAANQKLIENINSGDPRRANLLHILLFEMQILNEDLYLEAVVEQFGLGLIDLHACQFRKFAELKPELATCWATWTIPFDLVDDFCLIATAFYPSQPAVKFWQDKYAGQNIVWYASSVRSIQGALDKLEQIKSQQVKAIAASPGKTPGSGATKAPMAGAAKAGIVTPNKK